MSAERIEIRWTKDLETELLRWIVLQAQLAPVAASEVATAEGLKRASLRRLADAKQALKSLRTVIESAKVPVLDCDILDAVDRLKSAADAARAR